MKRAFLLLPFFALSCSQLNGPSEYPILYIDLGSSCARPSGRVQQLFEDGRFGGEWSAPGEVKMPLGQNGKYWLLLVNRDDIRDTIFFKQGTTDHDLHFTTDCH